MSSFSIKRWLGVVMTDGYRRHSCTSGKTNCKLSCPISQQNRGKSHLDAESFYHGVRRALSQAQMATTELSPIELIAMHLYMRGRLESWGFVLYFNMTLCTVPYQGNIIVSLQIQNMQQYNLCQIHIIPPLPASPSLSRKVCTERGWTLKSY